MKRLWTVVVVALATFGLVAGIDMAAYAKSGKSVLLGKSNKAITMTRIKNYRGPALELTSKAGQPPFRTKSTGKVANLNADKVDGLSASALQTRIYTGTNHNAWSNSSGSANDIVFSFPKAPVGDYLVTYTLRGARTTVAATGAVFLCYVRHKGAPLSDGGALTNNSGNIYTAASGSTTISGNPVDYSISCYTNDNATWRVDSYVGMQITLVSANALTKTGIPAI